jgi:hypothetical protein
MGVTLPTHPRYFHFVQECKYNIFLVRFPAQTTNLSLVYMRCRCGGGGLPASYLMDSSGFTPEVKRPERETDHSIPSNAFIA